MSDFGEEIIERLNDNTPLKDADNPMRKIILNTIGEWLNQYYDKDFFEQFFLATASDDYLDLHGISYNVYRNPEETDEDYRKRIVYETLDHITPNYIEELYDVTVYVNAVGLLIAANGYYNSNVPVAKLTSDNPYISSETGYFILPRNWTQTKRLYDVLRKKMVLGNKITISRLLPIEI